jgi:hypothetical protein
MFLGLKLAISQFLIDSHLKLQEGLFQHALPEEKQTILNSVDTLKATLNMMYPRVQNCECHCGSFEQRELNDFAGLLGSKDSDEKKD